MKSIGIILAGGVGSRMQATCPKQYLELNQKEVISYSIDAFKKASSLDYFFIVMNDDSIQRRRVEIQYGVDTIVGGCTRNESFRRALDYISSEHSDCEKVFVNEAARPMITPKIIDDYMHLLNAYDYIYSCSPITDSLETVTGEFADRNDFRLVRSPEGYRFKNINQYFTSDSNTTFPGHTLPKSNKGYPYTDYKNNMKLTYMEDVRFIEYLLERL